MQHESAPDPGELSAPDSGLDRVLKENGDLREEVEKLKRGLRSVVKLVEGVIGPLEPDDRGDELAPRRRRRDGRRGHRAGFAAPGCRRGRAWNAAGLPGGITA